MGRDISEQREAARSLALGERHHERVTIEGALEDAGVLDQAEENESARGRAHHLGEGA